MWTSCKTVEEKNPRYFSSETSDKVKKWKKKSEISIKRHVLDVLISPITEVFTQVTSFPNNLFVFRQSFN